MYMSVTDEIKLLSFRAVCHFDLFHLVFTTTFTYIYYWTLRDDEMGVLTHSITHIP